MTISLQLVGVEFNTQPDTI